MTDIPAQLAVEGAGIGKRIATLVAATLVKTGRPALEVATVRTPITVESGPWSGHVVRRARKLFKCDDRCGHWIAGGELYLQGDTNPYEAGGFAHDRLCLKCAGPMALHAVAAAVAKEPQP